LTLFSILPKILHFLLKVILPDYLKPIPQHCTIRAVISDRFPSIHFIMDEKEKPMLSVFPGGFAFLSKVDLISNTQIKVVLEALSIDP
jgi:hypothetical protein